MQNRLFESNYKKPFDELDGKVRENIFLKVKHFGVKSRNNKENNENAKGLKKVERSREQKPLVQFQTKYMSTTDVEIVNGNVA